MPHTIDVSVSVEFALQSAEAMGAPEFGAEGASAALDEDDRTRGGDAEPHDFARGLLRKRHHDVQGRRRHVAAKHGGQHAKVLVLRARIARNVTKHELPTTLDGVLRGCRHER